MLDYRDFETIKNINIHFSCSPDIILNVETRKNVISGSDLYRVWFINNTKVEQK